VVLRALSGPPSPSELPHESAGPQDRDVAPVDVTADQAIAQAAAARRGGSSLAEAKEFLRDLLGDGPVDAKSVLAGAKQNGISERTLDRAKCDLKISPPRMGAYWTASGNGDCRD
jgi:hypothetical protein